MGHTTESTQSGLHTTQLCHDLMQYVAAGLLVVQSQDNAALEESGAARLDTMREILLQMRDLVSAELDDRYGEPDRPVDVVALVKNSVRLVEVTHGCRVSVRSDGPVMVVGEPVMLRRAVVNVLDNAGRAAGRRGNIVVRVRGRAEHAVVEVADDGDGFGQIEPHTGHGLAIVDTALRRCRGRLDIKSSPGAGTRVRLTIPTQRRGAVR